MNAVESRFRQPEVERRFQQYMEDHGGDVTDLPRICEVFWNAGGRSAIAAMAEMSDILPLLGRIESRLVKLRSLM